MPRCSALVAILALLTSGSLAAGCSGCGKGPDGAAADAAPAVSATPASSSATVVESDAGATAASDHPVRRATHRGPGAMLFQAALALELLPAQRETIEAARRLDAPASDGAARDAANALNAELIAGIKAGHIDTAKIEPKHAAVEKLAVAERDSAVASLNALHAALATAQRRTVAAVVRARQAKREDHSAHEDAGPDAGKGARHGLDRMLRGLDLDAEQQKKIDAIAPKAELTRPDPSEMKRHIEALLSAFEKETFDARKTDAVDVKKSRVALEEETKILIQILPILEPEQREKLAARRDHGAARIPRRSGHGHRPLVESEDDDFAP